MHCYRKLTKKHSAQASCKASRKRSKVLMKKRSAWSSQATANTSRIANFSSTHSKLKYFDHMLRKASLEKCKYWYWCSEREAQDVSKNSGWMTSRNRQNSLTQLTLPGLLRLTDDYNSYRRFIHKVACRVRHGDLTSCHISWVNELVKLHFKQDINKQMLQVVQLWQLWY